MHRRLSVEHLLAEIHSWAVISDNRAETIIADALVALDEAIDATTPPAQASAGMGERLAWNVTRLAAGDEISEPRH